MIDRGRIMVRVVNDSEPRQDRGANAWDVERFRISGVNRGLESGGWQGKGCWSYRGVTRLKQFHGKLLSNEELGAGAIAE